MTVVSSTRHHAKTIRCRRPSGGTGALSNLILCGHGQVGPHQPDGSSSCSLGKADRRGGIGTLVGPTFLRCQRGERGHVGCTLGDRTRDGSGTEKG